MKVKQVIVTGQHQVELQEREWEPSRDPRSLLVETEWTFISTGTELANYTGREPQVFQPGAWCAYPWNSGYANVGIVREVGAAVERFQPGDRVFSSGSHASFVSPSTEALVVKVPDTIEPDIAVASRMAGVATSAVVMAELSLHPWVAVYGLGVVGNLAAQAFGILGARVIGIDPVAARRELAETCGVSVTIGDSGDAARARIRELTDGHMADVVIDATGLSPVINDAVKTVRMLGQLILLGSPRAAFETDMTPFLADVHLRYITVRGALEWASPTYPPTNAQRGPTRALTSLYEKQTMIFDWIREGRLHLAPLISHRLPPARIKEAYDGLLKTPEIFTGVALDWR